MSGFAPADSRLLPRAAHLARRAEGAVPQRLAVIELADLDLPPGTRRRPDPAAATSSSSFSFPTFAASSLRFVIARFIFSFPFEFRDNPLRLPF